LDLLIHVYTLSLGHFAKQNSKPFCDDRLINSK
jgi:hypothetical protein